MAEQSSTQPAKPEGRGAVTRYRWPGDMFADMQDRMNRMFDDFWRDLPAAKGGVFADLTPQVDVEEKEEAYLITAELPGMEEGDFELTVSDGMLTVKGEKKQESERDENNMHVSERAYGSFRRSFRLPPETDADGIMAAFDKGVLSVTVPKKPETESPVKKVEITKGR